MLLALWAWDQKALLRRNSDSPLMVLSDDDTSYYCSKRTGIFIQLLARFESIQIYSSISHHNLNIVCTTSNEILARIKSNYSMPSKLAYELWFYIAGIYWSQIIEGGCCMCFNWSFSDTMCILLTNMSNGIHSATFYFWLRKKLNCRTGYWSRRSMISDLSRSEFWTMLFLRDFGGCCHCGWPRLEAGDLYLLRATSMFVHIYQ